MGKRRIKKNQQPGYVGSGWALDAFEAQRKEKACTSKTTYYSKEQADEVALFIRAEHGEKVYPYECRYCDNWHLGHRYED